MGSGEEIEPPGPLFLESEAAGARLLCPFFLLICCVLLHGLVAEFLLLLYLAEPVEWPIRKRFFSLPGNRSLGALTFSCGSDGQVQVEGEPNELRTKNVFWIGEEKKWKLLHSEIAELAPCLITLRRLRLSGLCAAVAATVVLLAWAVVLGTQKISMWVPPSQALMMSAVVALIIWACPCLAELTA